MVAQKQQSVIKVSFPWGLYLIETNYCNWSTSILSRQLGTKTKGKILKDKILKDNNKRPKWKFLGNKCWASRCSIFTHGLKITNIWFKN